MRIKIRIKGQIDTHWASWFEDLDLSHDPKTDQTLLSGEVVDQAAFYGLIAKLRDLGLTLLSVNVDSETDDAVDVDPAAAQQMLDRSLAATRSGLQETRRALKSLRASPLDDLGLGLALRKLAEENSARVNLQLDLSLPERLPALSPDVEQCIYRVAQEAVANAAHHANAHTLTVRVSVDGPAVSLVVRDDGLGFDVRQGEASGHFGLPGMRERAQLAGGQLAIDSRPGRGTTIRLTIED